MKKKSTPVGLPYYGDRCERRGLEFFPGVRTISGQQRRYSTHAKVLGLELPSSNDLEARALDETLVGGSATEGAPETRVLKHPEPITNNAATILNFDAVRVAGRPAGLKTIPDTGGPSLLSFISGVMLVVCGALELI